MAADAFVPITARHSRPVKTRPGRYRISSYVVGGEPVTGATFGAGLTLVDIPPATSLNGFSTRYNATTGKLQAFRSGQTNGLITESWPDVKGGIFAALTADQAAASLNDAVILALTDATVTTAGGLASAAGLTAGLTNPNTINAEVDGRNVVVAQNQNGAGGTWTAGFARVTGTRKGAAQVEDIALQVTAIADTKFRLTPGLLAFDTVTNVQLLNAAKTAAQAGPASSRLSVGVGTIYALKGVITGEPDIKSVRKDNAAIAAATYIGTPNQIDMGANVADSVDIIVEYDAILDGRIVREAIAGEDIGAVVLQPLVY